MFPALGLGREYALLLASRGASVVGEAGLGQGWPGVEVQVNGPISGYRSSC